MQISAAHRDALRRLARPLRLAMGEALFHEGDPGDALFIVGQGTIEISVASADGRKLSLDLVRPGAVLGEIALFDPGPRTATARAVEDACLHRLSRQDLRDGVTRDPEVAFALLALAGHRMRYMSREHRDRMLRPLPARLARRLLHVADDDGRVPLNQSQLAEFVGSTREAVSKTLNRWRREGHIAAERGPIRIVAPHALSEIAEDADFSAKM
jgi:CRP-like cAMP-binding protein